MSGNFPAFDLSRQYYIGKGLDIRGEWGEWQFFFKRLAFPYYLTELLRFGLIKKRKN